MRQLLTTIFLMAACAFSAGAVTAAEALASAPQNVFPLLDRNTRLDMIDYFNSGMSTPSANSLQGQSVITALSPDALSVRMTDSSTAQLVVLSAGRDSIVALITTVAAPGLDSNIKFYDSKWTPLPATPYFTKPDWKDWMVGSDKADREMVTTQVPFMLASYAIDPASKVLTITNNLDRFLDKDIYAMLSPYLHPALTYRWDGGRFKQQ